MKLKKQNLFGSKTQTVLKFKKKSNCDKPKMVTRLKNLKCYPTQKLKLLGISKNQIMILLTDIIQIKFLSNISTMKQGNVFFF